MTLYSDLLGENYHLILFLFKFFKLKILFFIFLFHQYVRDLPSYTAAILCAPWAPDAVVVVTVADVLCQLPQQCLAAAPPPRQHGTASHWRDPHALPPGTCYYYCYYNYCYCYCYYYY